MKRLGYILGFLAGIPFGIARWLVEPPMLPIPKLKIVPALIRVKLVILKNNLELEQDRVKAEGERLDRIHRPHLYRGKP
jgi:hypothetical protein